MVAAADWMSMMFCDPDGWNLNPCTTTKAVNFGTAPMPVDTAQYSTLYGSGVVGANAMGISRGSNVKAAAWIVLKELATDKTLSVSWANANGDPASLLAARTASSGVTYPAFYKTFYTISAHRLSGYHELWNTGEHLEEGAVQSFMAAWQAGTIDNLSDGLDELTDEVNNILDDNS
jgi:maltose-binding protein MalE